MKMGMSLMILTCMKKSYDKQNVTLRKRVLVERSLVG